MSKTVADKAYEMVEWTAQETTSASGLAALLALLEKFGDPAGLPGVNASIKQRVIEKVKNLYAGALDKEAQGQEN